MDDDSFDTPDVHDTSEEAWDCLLKDAADRRITITELMRRALPFFSFGKELAEKYRENSIFEQDNFPL